jgi:ketosteroid isomerase-like protein
VEHVALLKEYERKLGHHSWEAVEDLIHDDAVFIFSEGTFRGKQEIGQAFMRTFEIIQDEVYSIHDLHWLVVNELTAACIYEFRWQGIVNGQKASGGVRGTSILQKTPDGWKIIHEHLGPYPS